MRSLSDVRIHPYLALINLVISLVQLSSLGNVSRIHNLHYSGGHCL